MYCAFEKTSPLAATIEVIKKPTTAATAKQRQDDVTKATTDQKNK